MFNGWNTFARQTAALATVCENAVTVWELTALQQLGFHYAELFQHLPGNCWQLPA